MWKVRLCFVAVMALILGIMAVMPMLILIVVPLLIAITKWSAVAWSAESVMHDRRAYADVPEQRKGPEAMVKRARRQRARRVRSNRA